MNSDEGPRTYMTPVVGRIGNIELPFVILVVSIAIEIRCKPNVQIALQVQVVDVEQIPQLNCKTFGNDSVKTGASGNAVVPVQGILPRQIGSPAG